MLCFAAFGHKHGRQKRVFELRSRLPCPDTKSGLRPEIGKEWPKNGFWPHREKGKKMAEKWENWPKNGSKMAIFPFFGHLFPLFPGGAKIHFSANFFPFRAGGPIWGLYRAIGIAIFELKKCTVSGLKRQFDKWHLFRAPTEGQPPVLKIMSKVVFSDLLRKASPKQGESLKKVAL